MVRSTGQQPRKHRRGAAVVEFAFIAPVMFMMLLGMIEFGRAIMVANVLTAAAREGARAGALPSSTNTDITTAVNNHLTAGAIKTSAVTTTVKVNSTVANASTAVTGNTVSVTLSVPYNQVTWMPTTFLIPKTSTLTSSAVMRRE